MSAYYNEIDPFAAQWLRNLIAKNLIAPGDVDTRSIVEVKPDDLKGYTQCHWFAGIGGWSYALRLAGWPDDRPVWTGSCPCQPFSAAGKQRGSDDERHLWPTLFNLIRECRPGTVIGEQVAGAAGAAWWDHVAADLETAGYAAAAANLGAHSVGAPHLRQRLYWVANAQSNRDRSVERVREWQTDVEPAGMLGPVAITDSGLRGEGWSAAPRQTEGGRAYGGLAGRGDVGRVDYTIQQGLEGHRTHQGPSGWDSEARPTATTGALDAWSDLEWLQCSDGKARPTQPGIFPLAHGVSNRVGRLRAYGNAIVPQVAAAFVMACDL